MKPINWLPTILERDCIVLTPLNTSHFDSLYSVASDPLIWEQHPSKDRYKKEVFQLFFDSGVASNSAFIITDKNSNQVIGSTRYYDYRPEQGSIAIGYTFIARNHWGGSSNYFCKNLLLNYAFQYVSKVFFHVGIDNIRSQKAVLKLGADKVREFDFESNGIFLPYIEFELCKNSYIDTNE
jgi:RimJ/RimL family protein N-acetyltransferase